MSPIFSNPWVDFAALMLSIIAALYGLYRLAKAMFFSRFFDIVAPPTQIPREPDRYDGDSAP